MAEEEEAMPEVDETTVPAEGGTEEAPAEEAAAEVEAPAEEAPAEVAEDAPADTGAELGEALPPPEDPEAENAAATKVQSLFRGNQDRKRINDIKAEKDAAVAAEATMGAELGGPPADAGAPPADQAEIAPAPAAAPAGGAVGGEILPDEAEDVIGEQELCVEDIVQTCLRNGTLFEDPTFPAADKSLFSNPFEYPSYVSNGVGVSSWRRPEQISRSAVIFAEGRPPGDVASGDMNDKWFLGAAAVVSTRPDLIANNFAHVEYQRDAGVVVCRLFKEGEWKEVLIDTRLPYSDSVDARRPTYGHCLNKEEMWLPLMEKAMAKYMGSYEALCEGGNLSDALVDLTGGSVESFDLTSPQIQNLAQSGELWHFVRNWFITGCLLACVLEEDESNEAAEHPDGILPNLAYGILDVVEADGIKMIRIRNPWGESEWKGAFADHDQMWNKHPELREKLKYEFGPDGTWWMRFEDWVSAYNKLHVCRLFPQHYQQHCISGVWFDLTAAGAPQPIEQRTLAKAGKGDEGKGEDGKEQDPASPGATDHKGSKQVAQVPQADPDPRWFNNPQFRITTGEKMTTLYISLTQSETNPTYMPTNVMVLKAKPNGRLWDCNEADLLGTAVEVQSSTPSREVTYELVLHPSDTGQNYVLVCYQDLPKPDPTVKMTFHLRVFASEPINIESIPPPIAESFTGDWKPESSAGGRRLRSNRMENPNWCRNPQIFLNFKKPTCLKIVLERHLGKRRNTHGTTVGFTVTRLAGSTEPKAVTKQKKKVSPGSTFATTGGIRPPEQEAPELGNPKRKLQVLPSDWVQETSYALEDMACMYLMMTPQQGPLTVVPSLSEESQAGQFTLSIFSDRPLKDAVMLSEKNDVVLPGKWESDTAGGCHLYSPPFEQAKSSTWGRNPRFSLVVPTRTALHVTLARCERPWRQQIAKDAVGCMLGFYIVQDLTGEGISRESMVAETTFVPSHEVSIDVQLPACTPEQPYWIVPCTYEPGKVGEFMVRVSSDGKFDFDYASRR
eukprot:gnl/MRDRNA2_/MRDRNA2_98175_c0_seq1.p1 gnl/MRDRNA2_/MRDRNA2_98175_c0~~gnl/MRDRNA2_/MRDRNA2_98175_c0_seq1.p1  ORF type:complete len:1012 (+),score=238.22 gnl/MRDRNA2_/MRDRNA2_98175_c0_seq1:86-3121(+)